MSLLVPQRACFACGSKEGTFDCAGSDRLRPKPAQSNGFSALRQAKSEIHHSLLWFWPQAVRTREENGIFHTT
jgi:hypothetical protein